MSPIRSKLDEMAKLREESKGFKFGYEKIKSDQEYLTIARTEHELLERALRIALEAHAYNANSDYRGNRTTESVHSFKCLKEIAALFEEKNGDQS